MKMILFYWDVIYILLFLNSQKCGCKHCSKHHFFFPFISVTYMQSIKLTFMTLYMSFVYNIEKFVFEARSSVGSITWIYFLTDNPRRIKLRVQNHMTVLCKMGLELDVSISLKLCSNLAYGYVLENKHCPNLEIHI